VRDSYVLHYIVSGKGRFPAFTRPMGKTRGPTNGSG
jgi:hypothetical protein